jgi:hypothetical protein
LHAQQLVQQQLFSIQQLSTQNNTTTSTITNTSSTNSRSVESTPLTPTQSLTKALEAPTPELNIAEMLQKVVSSNYCLCVMQFD